MQDNIIGVRFIIAFGDTFDQLKENPEFNTRFAINNDSEKLKSLIEIVFEKEKQF